MQSGQLPRKLGLIIGVNNYLDSTFRPLRFAENDAKAFAQWLGNAKGGQWNPPDVQLLLGQQATKELTESLLTQLCLNIAQAGDEILLYFAGHAFVDERSGDGYLALANSRYQDASTALNIRAFLQSIQTQSRAGHILCILDCFQTGPIWNMRKTSPYDAKPLLGASALAGLQQLSNRLFLCSCRGNELASESGENSLGTLVHRMILGLCGPAVESATGNATLTKLHAYLFNQLPEQHRPQLFGQQTTPFILVGNAAPVATPALATANSSFSPASPNYPPQAKAPGSPTGGLLKMRSFGQMAAPTAQPPMFAAPNTGTLQNTTGSLQNGMGALQNSTGTLQNGIAEQLTQCKQLVQQAQQQMQSQNFKDAFDLVEQALQLLPNDIPALTLKGQLLGTAGQLAEANATVELILQNDPNNALAWSMRAVLLSNTGQVQLALVAIEKSLELDPANPESYGIKTHIMESIAAAQTNNAQGTTSNLLPSQVPVKDTPRSFLIMAGLQILGFILGTVGAGSLYVLHQNVPYINLALVCLGLALMIVVAAQGAFRYGFTRLIPTILVTIISAAILGGAYKVLGLAKITANIEAQTTNQGAILRLFTFSFIGIWLATAALLPLVAGIVGWIAGVIARATRKKG